MNVFAKFLDYITTPREVENTPENIAKWEKRAPGWILHCNKCGMEEPYGKYGVLWKSAGRKRNFGRCPQCRAWSWLVIYKGSLR